MGHRSEDVYLYGYSKDQAPIIDAFLGKKIENSYLNFDLIYTQDEKEQLLIISLELEHDRRTNVMALLLAAHRCNIIISLAVGAWK
jgi:hypothetical protein